VGNPTGATGIAQTLSGSNTSYGANLNWSRSLTPKLSSSATLGYAIAVVGHQKTLASDWQLTYTMSETFHCVLHYQFINVDSPIVAGAYQRNQVEISVTRSF